MFEITSLHGVTDFDEEQFKRDGIRAHPPIAGPNGEYFGHEWARWRYDTLDQAVDRWLEQHGSCAVLDAGSATGLRASEFAAAGHRVTALDIVAVPARDSPSSVEFVQADIRSLEATHFTTRFDLVHARRLVNFLTIGEIDRLFGLARAVMTPRAVLAISLFASDVGQKQLRARSFPGSRPPLPLYPGLVAHHFAEVHGLLDSHGLEIVEAFSDGHVETGFIARRTDSTTGERPA